MFEVEYKEHRIEIYAHSSWGDLKIAARVYPPVNSAEYRYAKDRPIMNFQDIIRKPTWFDRTFTKIKTIEDATKEAKEKVFKRAKDYIDFEIEKNTIVARLNKSIAKP